MMRRIDGVGFAFGSGSWRGALLGAVVAAVVVLEVTAQAVPAAQQAALFSRILAYDRNLKARAGAEVAVGIVFNGDDAASRAASDQMLAAFVPLKVRTIHDLPFDVVAGPYAGASRLGEWIDSQSVDVIYLAPGLEAAFAEIVAVAAKRKVAVLTPQRPQVQLGAAIGVVIKDGKPGILVNLGAARSLGMDLDPKLLQLSEVIR